MRPLLLFLFLLLVPFCALAQLPQLRVYMDSLRVRKIPVAVYAPEDFNILPNGKIILFSHGYSSNDTSSYKCYHYLGNALAAKGYRVYSIQHELISDSLMPLKGDVWQVRKPFWDRGVANIRFVANQLFKEHKPIQKFIVGGHSQGGDMSALFATQFPEQTAALFTLDHRRVPLPLSGKFPILSIRSSDQHADAGVLPEKNICDTLRIRLVSSSIKHNDMDVTGTKKQHHFLIKSVLSFLQTIVHGK
jgi:hypothetical protein